MHSTSEPVWKPGRIETTSPNAEEKFLDIEYLIFAGAATGRFRLKKDPNNACPGKLFQMTGSTFFGWRKYNQKLQLETGNIVQIPGQFILEDGFFKTDGAAGE